ncbi:MAG: PAS domain-containing sensor histidine kinase [Candidatus Omnitrophota bacterium]
MMPKQLEIPKKPNQKNLSSKYELLSGLMDWIPDVIYFKDKKGTLVMVNKAHARGLGLSPEEVAGKTDFDFFPKEKAVLMAKDDNYVMRTGRAIIDKIERATSPAGIDNYVSTTKIPRYDENGNIAGIIGITRDITHRMQLERLKEDKALIQKKLQVLQELDNMKSEFVSIVSHELRTPLAIMKEAMSLVLDGIAGPVNEKQKKLLATARNNGDRLNKVVDDLLDVSRIEKGKLLLRKSRADLNNLLMESSRFYKGLAQENSIRLEYSLPKKKIYAFIDPDRINQVFSNLITNAIKFTEQNGEIKVKLETIKSNAIITVTDTGIGLSEQDIAVLFDKFVQVTKTPAQKRKGLGLGLYISKQLVEKHGGKINVESKPGVGSKFYFTLPLGRK